MSEYVIALITLTYEQTGILDKNFERNIKNRDLQAQSVSYYTTHRCVTRNEIHNMTLTGTTRAALFKKDRNKTHYTSISKLTNIPQWSPA